METALAEASTLNIASHLIGVPNTDWAFWKWIGLRRAGFPASAIVKLASPPGMGAATDQVQESMVLKGRKMSRSSYATLLTGSLWKASAG